MTTWRNPFQNLLLRVEAAFDRAFAPAWNPVRQLGTLTFFLFWIVAVSGIYVYILFETTAVGAFQSIEYMTHQQWYVGGIMRSLHRYASDAMVVTLVLHLGREFIMDRYRGVRWYAWFTGVPLIWFLYMSGISGYWLVWDQLAQYIAIGSMEWIDWLGILGEPVANNFLSPDSLTDRFFSLLVFIHIFVPLFLLFLMWIHVIRLSRPKVNPPRGLALGCLAMLVALSLAKPAVSHPPADLATVPMELGLDWFYMAFYPLFDRWGGGVLWLLTVGGSCLLCVMPWLPPLRQAKAAEVILSHCNGCERCAEDCPYAAITMRPRTDGLPFDREAVVKADQCIRCGICVGACPASTPFRHEETLITGIDLPDRPLHQVRVEADAALDRLAGETEGGAARVLIVGCERGAEADRLAGPGIAVLRLPCIAMLPPAFIDYALSRRGADGLVVAGCREGGCYNRFGVDWMDQRLAGLRDPYLRKRVPRERLQSCWAGRTDDEDLAGEVARFRTALATTDGAGGG